MKNMKRVLFSVESTRNIYWDNTPITVGCQLVIPNKFEGDQPLCRIMSSVTNCSFHFILRFISTYGFLICIPDR